MNNYELPRAHIQCMLLLWVATNAFAMVNMVKVVDIVCAQSTNHINAGT